MNNHFISACLSLTLLSLLTTHGIAQAENPNRRIINGTAASTSTYPWMGSLYIDGASGVGGSGCGASLIAPQWVLTAAHCFVNEAGDALDMPSFQRTTVTLRSDDMNNLSANAIERTVINGFPHPNYQPAQGDNFDIALLQLDRPVEGVQAVTLIEAGTPVPDGTTAIVMGWGATRVENGQSVDASSTLLQVEQQVVSTATCNESYGNGITENMLCAGGFNNTDTRDSCQGDSGGPLVVPVGNRHVQVGIVSFGGDTCGDPNTPGVYARVSQFKSFIQQQVTDAQFATLSTSTTTPDTGNNTNCGVQLDAQLNIALPCLVANGQALQSGLNFTPNSDGSPVWTWNGSVSPSTCPVDTAVCASLGNDLSLTLPNVNVNGTTYNPLLGFIQDNSGNFRWNVQRLN